MKYGKLIDGNLVVDLTSIFLSKNLVSDPIKKEILSAGYLPIEETEEPANREGYIKSSKWVQTDTAIIRKWTVTRDMRPLSQSAVIQMLIRHQINNLEVDDNTALRMRSFYPEWESGASYAVGYKVQRNGKLWRVVQAHTAQVTWEPENAPSLWESINETHDGTIDDAIPYDGNMRLEKGKYYVQNNIIYLCTADTVNPVYHALADLVGQYVTEV